MLKLKFHTLCAKLSEASFGSMSILEIRDELLATNGGSYSAAIAEARDALANLD
jgi:hypothetical protein